MKTLVKLLVLLPLSFCTAVRGQEINWGKHPAVTVEFKTKAIAVAQALDIDPSHLMTVIAIETSKVVSGNPEPTFDPAIKNPGSTAVGLIQFTAATAADLGTTTDKIKQMKAVEQLDWVQKYFAKVKASKGELKTVEDVYLAVFYPALIGKPDTDALPSGYYNANKGFDKNNDGKITRAEIAAYAKKRDAAGAALKG